MDSSLQRELQSFVNREVYYCQSALVEELLNKEIISYDDFVNLYDEETDEYQEIYEYWIVSEWLAEKLEQESEPVIKSDFGTWWGRTCTGQAIMLDSVIEKIYTDLQNI